MAKAQGDITPDSIRQIVRQELQRTAPSYLKGDRLLCICADCFFAFLLGQPEPGDSSPSTNVKVDQNYDDPPVIAVVCPHCKREWQLY